MMANRVKTNKRALRNLGRRGMSLFLAMVMMLSMVQIGAFATGTTPTSEMQILKQGDNDLYYEYNKDSGLLVLDAETPQIEEWVTNRPSTDTNPSEVKISKTIAGTDTENVFDITLQVETTQNVVKSSEYPDAAVVIVLDVSGSMQWCVGCGEERDHHNHTNSSDHPTLYYCDDTKTNQFSASHTMGHNPNPNCSNCGESRNEHYVEFWCSASSNGTSTTTGRYQTTRLQANKTAAKAFLDTYAASAAYKDSNNQDRTAKRYISLVTYNPSASIKLNRQWLDVSIASNLTTVKNAIDSLTANNGTNVSGGLAAADTMLSSMPTGSDNNTMSRGNAFVLLLGDGTPEGSYTAAPTPSDSYAQYSDKSETHDRYIAAEKWARKIRTEGTKILAAYSGSNSNDAGYVWFQLFTNQVALCSNVDSLKQTFNAYVTLMRLAAKAWEVHDPMGTNYTYVQSNTSGAHITPNANNTEITWTLRADTPTVYTSDAQGNKTNTTITYDQYLAKLNAGSKDIFHLVYTASYRIQLDSLGTGATSYAPTNGPTYLNYYLVDKNGKAVNEKDQEVHDGETAANGKQPMPKLYFNVPAAKALSANLAFTKQTTANNDLADAVFHLFKGDTAADITEANKMGALTGTSDTQGNVSIPNIPSKQTYMLDETSIPTGHTKAADLPYKVTVAWGEITVTDKDGTPLSTEFNEATNTYTLTKAVQNPYHPAPTTKTVTKVWQVPAGKTHPGSVTVTLTGTYDGETVYSEEKNITSANDWTVEFENVPTKDTETGNPISYTVSENAVEGYTTTYDQSTLTVTNTWNNEYTVTKVWEVLNDSEKTPVTVALLRDGSVVPDLTVTLNSDKAWTHTFTDVPYMSPDGKVVYTYTVAELGDSGYVTTTADDESNTKPVTLNGNNFDATFNQGTLTITNRTAQDTVSVSGTKTWVGPEDSYSTTVYLQSDEAEAGTFADVAGKTATVTTANPGYTFSNLPKYTSTGPVREIVYKVTDSQAGFTTEGGEKDKDGNYNLINTIIQVFKDIDVTKIWVDDNNADDTRPGSLTLNLFANSERYDSQTFDVYEVDPDTTYRVYKDTQTITFNVPTYDSNGKVINYTVDEADVPDGYIKTVNGFTVTNKLDDGTTSRTVRKVWEAPSSVIPESISFTITGSNGYTNTVNVYELTDDTAWSYTWSDLAKYSGGKLVKYTITEDGVTGGEVSYTLGEGEDTKTYTFTSSTAVKGTTTTITNRIKDLNDLTVTGTKTWVDNGSVRPTGNITFTLMSNAKDAATYSTVTSQTVDIAATGETQTYTFSGLPRYAYDVDKETGATSVRFINYRVVDSVSGYETSHNTVNAGTNDSIAVDLTNTFQQTYTFVSGTKHWVDGNDVDARPQSITVGLFQDNVKIDEQVVTPDEDGIWTYTFGKNETDGSNTLPVKKNADSDYVYTVQELTTPDGYTVSYATASHDITNTREDIGDVRDITVTKYWRGPAPESSITVELLDDSQATQHTFTLNADNNWTDTIEDLPKYNTDGSAIQYTIRESGENDGEVTIDGLGYDVTYEQATFTLKNTIQQDTTSISGTKTWDLAGNEARLPEELTVALYADGQYDEPVATQDITAEDEWTYTFEELPKYALGDDGDGHEIVYTVREMDAMGNLVADSVKFGGKQYDVTYDGTNITNTFSPANSDTYRYVAYAHYVTYTYDNVEKSVDTENVIELTSSFDPTSVTINPDTYNKAGFTYQAGISTLYIGTQRQDNVAAPAAADAELPNSVLFPAGTDTVVTVDQANKLYKIDLYYTLTEQAPPPPPAPPTPPTPPSNDKNYYYRIDYVYTGYDAEGSVIYSDEVTGTVKFKADDKHSFTADLTTSHDGHGFYLVGDENFSASLDGTTRSNPYVFTVYYEFTELEEPEVPEAPLPPVEPPVDIPEDDVPKADVPATGDNLMLWVMAAAVSGIGLIWNTISGKKKEEETV